MRYSHCLTESRHGSRNHLSTTETARSWKGSFHRIRLFRIGCLHNHWPVHYRLLCRLTFLVEEARKDPIEGRWLSTACGTGNISLSLILQIVFWPGTDILSNKTPRRSDMDPRRSVNGYEQRLQCTLVLSRVYSDKGWLHIGRRRNKRPSRCPGQKRVIYWLAHLAMIWFGPYVHHLLSNRSHLSDSSSQTDFCTVMASYEILIPSLLLHRYAICSFVADIFTFNSVTSA